MKPSRMIVLLIVLTSLCLSFSARARDAEFDVTTRTNIMVAMRDGVKLATDLYLPAKNGAVAAEEFPVILTRLPYNKNGSKRFGEYYAARGYVFVAQDTRGRFASEGVWHMITDDGPDGVDCAAWIGRQPWSSGKIGMFGTSYVGGTQHAMALEKVPQLTTIIPVDAMSNLGRQSMRNAGAFEMRFWNWIMLNAGRGSRAGRDPATASVLREMSDNRLEYLRLLPLRKGTTPLKLAPEYEEWLVAAMSHGANDAFWLQNNIVDHPDRYKDMPVYLVGGWYDSWAGNTTANFMALTKAIKGPVYLIMGPWIHGLQDRFEHGQVSFGKDAAIPDALAWRLEWYDRWLKGRDNSVGKAAPFATKVRIFVMGTGDGRKVERDRLNHGGYWRDENEWPLARTRYTNYYFQPNGGLSTEVRSPGFSRQERPETKTATANRERKTLRTASPAKAGTRNLAATARSTSFEFDPRNPVPTLGGCISSGNDIMQQGAWDQRGGTNFWNWPKPIPLSARNDVLVFQTEPLAEDVEVTGEIEVRLWASSSAVDTDFTAKLLDVYPPSADFAGGFDLNIGDGIVRARFRESLKQERLMKPGTIYPFTIKLYPTSNVFKKGHRIRVDISSSNFPRFDVNPNTGEPLNDHRRMVIATNTIHHDRDHPSHIVLPVIPVAGK